MSIMWPMVLDYGTNECKMMLRNYELEAYSNVMTALRAQGDLNIERKKILRDLASILSIPLERHRSEVRRVINDEKLYTIAYNISGPNIAYEWTLEGKRLIPLLPRIEPQTSFMPLANTCANYEATRNISLPEPSKTRSLKTKAELIPEENNYTHKKSKTCNKAKISDTNVESEIPVFSHLTSLPSKPSIDQSKASSTSSPFHSEPLNMSQVQKEMKSEHLPERKGFTDNPDKVMSCSLPTTGNGEITKSISQTSNFHSSTISIPGSSASIPDSTIPSTIFLQNVKISVSSEPYTQNTPSIFSNCPPSTSASQLFTKSHNIVCKPRLDSSKIQIVSKSNNAPKKMVYFPIVRSPNPQMLNNVMTNKLPDSSNQQLYLCQTYNKSNLQLNSNSISKLNPLSKINVNLPSTSKGNKEISKNSDSNGRALSNSLFSYSSVNLSNKEPKSNTEVGAPQRIASTTNLGVIELNAPKTCSDASK